MVSVGRSQEKKASEAMTVLYILLFHLKRFYNKQQFSLGKNHRNSVGAFGEMEQGGRILFFLLCFLN